LHTPTSHTLSLNSKHSTLFKTCGSRRAEKDREEQKVRQGVDGYEDLEQEP